MVDRFYKGKEFLCLYNFGPYWANGANYAGVWLPVTKLKWLHVVTNTPGRLPHLCLQLAPSVFMLTASFCKRVPQMYVLEDQIKERREEGKKNASSRKLEIS